MTTPSNDQDPAKNEASKPTNPFQKTNVFKETPNPFLTAKLDAPSGGLLNSAASNNSQQDGKPGLFGLNTNNLFSQGNAQATNSGLFAPRSQPQKESSKQEDKTSAPSATGISGSSNWPSFNKTQGEQGSTSASAGFLKPSEKQEAKMSAPTGGLFGSSIPSKTEDKSEKQETKIVTPLPTGGLFAGGGPFGGGKAQTEAPKQEPKTEAPGIFGKTQTDVPKQTSGGLFGLTKPAEQKETEKQETKTDAPAAAGIFGSTTNSSLFGSIKTPAQGGAQKQENSSNQSATGGLFNLKPNESKAPGFFAKTEDKPEKQETTTGIFGSNTGSGLFGGAKLQTEAPKQEIKTGIFGGGQTNNITLGATNGNSQKSSTMFEPREAPTKKRKDEMSTLSPEKKTTNFNIATTGGVQSSLLNQPSKTPNLFGKEEPKTSQAPVDDSKLDAIFKSALAKEEKITQKIKAITSKMNNAQVVDQFLKEQNQAIDEFYAEFTQSLAKRVTEIANEQKQALKKKLSEEAQEFKKTTEELTGHFNKLLAENSLATVKDQLLSAAKNKKDAAEQAVKAALATSFELENGFSPLVKKYKAIKYTLPSLNLLSKPIDRQPATKQILLQKAEVVLPELEKLIEDINLALTDAIGSLSHPLKTYLPKISKCVELENSLLTPDFPFELSGVSSEGNTIPRDSKIREVVYKIHKNEAEKLRGLNILSKDGEEELVLRVKPVSVRYDLVPGDLVFSQAPCEIKSKNALEGTNDIEFELENVLTGIPQNEKLHSKWDQVHELVLTESLVLVKPNNAQKGYYTLMNLKDPKSTRGLVKAIKTDRTLNDKLQKELETILTEEKRALVQVLRIKGEDIIVSCKKLRK